MEVKEKNEKTYTIKLTYEELVNLRSDLEQAKGDWNTGDITNKILIKLKEFD